MENNIWIVEETVLRQLPEMEKPTRKFEEDSPFWNAVMKRDKLAYESALSQMPVIRRADNGLWSIGDELREGVDFELMDSNKWYFCRCEKCGWQGSSEKLLGGGQIADTGDYDDCYCPKCESKDVDGDAGEPYQGIVAIPIQSQSSKQIEEKADDYAYAIECLEGALQSVRDRRNLVSGLGGVEHNIKTALNIFKTSTHGK